jgi:hypothetical protein
MYWKIVVPLMTLHVFWFASWIKSYQRTLKKRAEAKKKAGSGSKAADADAAETPKKIA